MTSHERLHRCYFHQETDRPAVYTRTGFPENDPSYDRLKALMTDVMDRKITAQGIRVADRFSVREDITPFSDTHERVERTLETPLGTLKSLYFRGLPGYSSITREYFIRDREDAERYLSLPDPDVHCDADAFGVSVREIGERGIAEVRLGMNAAGFTAELCGSENFALLSVTDRDVLHELCRRRMETLLRVVNLCADRHIGPYFNILGQEFLTPPLHGVKDFRDFNVRYDKPVLDRVHEIGGRVHVHCHGPLKSVLPCFLEMGADVLHPIEPPPMGDVTAKQAREILGGRVCIEGNLQIAGMYESTPDRIREEVEALIRDAYVGHKGLIVSPSASPYIYGRGESCYDNYRAMVETVIRYRG